MSTIKIKRSGVSGAPANLGNGELAYSYLSYSGNSSPWTGGDKLYIGAGTEDVNGNADSVVVIGGKYFTDKLDHTPGTLIANSALIVDDNSKLDRLLVDDLELNGTQISSAGSLSVLVGNTTTDSVTFNNTRVTGIATPTQTADATNKAYVDNLLSGLTSGGIVLAADNGNNDVLALGQTVTFSGNTGITTTVTDNQIDIDLDDTTVTAGTYGSATEIPFFTVDSQGRLTAANTVSISTDLNIAGNTGTDAVNLLNNTLTVVGDTGIKTAVTNNQILVSTDDTGSAAFNTVSAVTSMATPTIEVTTSLTSNGNAVDVFTDSQDIEIGDSTGVGTTKINNNLEVGGNTVIIGDLTVQGNQVSISTQTLAVDDNIIFLNANSQTSAPDLGFVGTYNNDGANTALAEQAGFYYDASEGRFKVFDGYDATLTIGAFIDDTQPTYALSDIQAETFHGALSGNATTASSLETGRVIELTGDVAGSITFDGSANVSITTTIQQDSVALGTDTTGDYVKLIRTTSGFANNSITSDAINITRDQGEGGTYTISVDRASTANGSPGVASFDATNFDVQASGHVTIDTIDGGTY